MPTCFVIMPFSKTTEKHTKEYWTEHFIHFIKPAVEGAAYDHKLLGYEAKLADPSGGGIIKDVLKNLQEADVVLAELTDYSPNVMYELGIRHCLHDQTIMILENGQEIPFYFKNYKIIAYSNTTPKNMNDFKENIQRCLVDFMLQTSNHSPNPVADYFQITGQRIIVTPNHDIGSTLRGLRESGFSALYVSSTNITRNQRKEEVVEAATQYIKMIAETGHAYLASSESYFRDELEGRLQAGILVQMVLLNPWSESTILIALSELSEHPSRPLSVTQAEALDKLGQGNLTGIDPIQLIKESIFYERYLASTRGYENLHRQFKNRIEMHICTYAVPATALITEKTGFFEPYIHVHVSERRRKSMNTFELEFPSSNYLYRHCNAYFDTMWKISVPYEKFVGMESVWQTQLKKMYE